MKTNTINTKYNFWIYKSKINGKGFSPIYMRIIVGKNRTEISTGIYINVKNWDEKRQMIKGKEDNAEIYNAQIENLKASFIKVVKELIEMGMFLEKLL